MESVVKQIYNELVWFMDRESNLTTVLESFNCYEYYYEGKAKIDLRHPFGCSDVIDIFIVRDTCKGVSLETSSFKEYQLQTERTQQGYVHKTLTVYLNDGSYITLANSKEEGDPKESDIQLTDEYIRYLFRLPVGNKYKQVQGRGE